MINDSLCRDQINAGMPQRALRHGLLGDQVPRSWTPGPFAARDLRAWPTPPRQCDRVSKKPVRSTVTGQLDLCSNPALSKSLQVISGRYKILLPVTNHSAWSRASVTLLCPFSACSMSDNEQTHRKTTSVMILPSLVK